MKRRNLLKNIAVGTAGTLALSQAVQAQTSSSDAEIEWRMATSWLKGDLTFNTVQTFCERVKAMTDGQFIITPYEAGELTSALEVFDAVQSADVDCGHTISFYYLDRHPSLVFVSTLPFGLTPYHNMLGFTMVVA